VTVRSILTVIMLTLTVIDQNLYHITLLHGWGGESAYNFLMAHLMYFKTLLVCHVSVELSPKGDIGITDQDNNANYSTL